MFKFLFLNHIFFYFSCYITCIISRSHFFFSKLGNMFTPSFLFFLALTRKKKNLQCIRSLAFWQQQRLRSVLFTGRGPVLNYPRSIAARLLPTCHPLNFVSDSCCAAALLWLRGATVTRQNHNLVSFACVGLSLL